jgi:ABC-type multidrug transport system fused ATPase/permease subunit
VKSTSEDTLNLTSAALLNVTVTNDHVINATIYAADAPVLKNNMTSLTVAVSKEWEWMPSSETCIYVYIGLILAIIFLIILRVVCFFTMCTRASARLHDSVFSSITHATMAFFSHNPSGKVNSMLNSVGHSLSLFSIHQSLFVL